MKKFLSFLFGVLLPIMASAYDAKIDGIYYNFDGDQATVTYQNQYQADYYGSVIIPESVIYNGKDYNVASIGSSAFSRCSGLTSVTIGNSVTTIGGSAFSGCSSLSSITIPNSVTSIGGYAFSDCNGLTTITIPSSMKKIEEFAFLFCTGLNKVIVSDIAAWCGITFVSNPLSYAHHLYSDEETEITNLVIPNSVSSIGSGAFSGCSGLTSITIPYSVTSISSSAFRDCSSLSSVTIPESVTSIGDYTFSGCSSLTYVTIPYSVTSIGSSAFSGCSSLSSITIPNSVTSIGDWAFSECRGLTSITIPKSVTSIGKSVFYRCSGLTSVIIPNNLTSIGDRAFSDCSGLTSFTIPNSVTSIGDNAFSCCWRLTSITIPNSVTSIGSYAFSGCSGLKYVNLNCHIAGKWFSGLTKIESIEIGNGTESIVESAFSGCTGLISLTIGKNVSSIGYSAFANCSNLQSVTSLIENPFWIDNSVFQYSLSGSTILYVPRGKKQVYQNTFAWNQFPTILEISGNGEQKCATPTISYANGKLKFNCETEDVSYIYEITDSDIKIGYDTEVDLTVTYYITVYATKDGYQDSEVATATLCWIDVEPQTEGIIDEDAIAEVKAMPVLIQSQGSAITIQGAAEGTPIAIYDIEGKQYVSTIAEKNRTTITTSLRPDSIAVVKIGEKSVKVKL